MAISSAERVKLDLAGKLFAAYLSLFVCLLNYLHVLPLACKYMILL